VSEHETEIPALRTPGSDPGQLGAPLGPVRAIDPNLEVVYDLLAATGLIPDDRLAGIKEQAESRKRPISDAIADATNELVEVGVIPGDRGARILSRRSGLPLVDLALTGVDKEAAALFPLHVLDRYGAVAYELVGDTVKIALSNPFDLHGIDALRLATRNPLEFGVASRDEISVEIRKLLRQSESHGTSALSSFEAEFKAEEGEEEDLTDLDAEDGISDAPLVRLVNSVFLQAAEDGASDIHFAPQADSLIVRFRVDGVLHEMQEIPKRMTAGVVTRLKVLAKLDIAERRKPQDGRISLNAAAVGRALDVRVATLPTVEGESVVMRLLDKSKTPPTLEELGLSEEMRATLSDVVSRPTGALLVTGPTGSGKSTTLFAALNQINKPEINIITVEDPVEYRLKGINQVQINARAGMTFAAALRSILRSDPDVVMVGEIRDGETAKISIEAALTGHLVLSTLHTNDAPSALTRLNEMGVEPFLVGAAVTGVLAQRLARKLCQSCCEMYTPTADDLVKARLSPDAIAQNDGMMFYRHKGCPRCGQTGYKGRIGIYQLLAMTEDLASLAAAKATREDIERAAHATGMRNLWDDGIAKIKAGLTDFEELMRVTV
jgi:type IV pilus assembly protein PilB